MFENRAVSDAIGFVIVFSMIIVSVGVVYSFGYGSVTDMRDAEQLTNAERTFLTLNRNFDDVRRREAPSRSAEVNLNGGKIDVRRGAEISIDVDGPGTYDDTLSVTSLTYSYRNDRVTYENGAVFRQSDDTSVMISPPSLRCVDEDGDGDPEYAIVSVVTMEDPGTSMGGDQVVTVTGTRKRSNLVFPANRSKPGSSVEVSFDGPNEEGWNRHLDDSDTWADVGGGTYRCAAPGGLDQVYVRQTVLNVTFTN